MLTPKRIAELEKVVEEVTKAYHADTQAREEDRVYDEQGPHGLAVLHIARGIAEARASDARIARAIKPSKAQKARAADEVLAHAIVQPLVNGLPPASASLPGKQPAQESDSTLPRRAKPRRKPMP